MLITVFGLFDKSFPILLDPLGILSGRRQVQPSFHTSNDCSIEHDKSKLCSRHNSRPFILQRFAYSIVVGLCA